MRSRGALRLFALVVAGWVACLPAAGEPRQADRQPTAHRLALPGYRFEFPRDHFDHPDFETEWWYFTGNLQAADGHRFGFELTFFRQAVDRARRTGESPWAAHDVYLAHFALSDLDGGRFLHEERTNRKGPGLAGVRGLAPSPKEAGGDVPPGTIWNGNWRVQIGETRSAGRESALALALEAVASRYGLHLTMSSAKPPVINGVNGVSQKAAGVGQASHYISLSRLVSKGRLDLDGRTYAVEGTTWMDHEFFTNQLGRNQRGWDWVSLQLADGTELMAYRLRGSDGSVDAFSAGTFVERTGRASHLGARDFSMTPTGAMWTSPQTKARYPTEWRVVVPSRGLDLLVRTPLPSQELSGGTGWTPTYWEGAVTASGTKKGEGLRGVGYLELTGYDKAVVLGPPR